MLCATGNAEAGAAGIDAAKVSAQEAASRLLDALRHGTTADVALAAERAYLLVGRLAVLARTETPQT